MELGSYITLNGNAVLTELLATEGPLEFTRAEIGAGQVTSAAAARERTSLIDKLADIDVVSCVLSNNQAVITLQYQNSGQTEDWSIGEIGIYCKSPADPAQEVLYNYSTFGDTPDTIVAESTSIYTRTYKVIAYVSDLQQVTVDVTPAGMVSQSDLENALESMTTSFTQQLELKADKIIDNIATGTPGVDPLSPVFTGSDGKLGVLGPQAARVALGVPEVAGVQVALPASGWSAEEPYTQTVAVEGVTETANLIVSGDPTDAEKFLAWQEAGVYCSAQAAGSMTFTCSTVPETDLTANVVVLGG